MHSVSLPARTDGTPLRSAETSKSKASRAPSKKRANAFSLKLRGSPEGRRAERIRIRELLSQNSPPSYRRESGASELGLPLFASGQAPRTSPSLVSSTACRPISMPEPCSVHRHRLKDSADQDGLPRSLQFTTLEPSKEANAVAGRREGPWLDGMR